MKEEFEDSIVSLPRQNSLEGTAPSSGFQGEEPSESDFNYQQDEPMNEADLEQLRQIEEEISANAEVLGFEDLLNFGGQIESDSGENDGENNEEREASEIEEEVDSSHSTQGAERADALLRSTEDEMNSSEHIEAIDHQPPAETAEPTAALNQPLVLADATEWEEPESVAEVLTIPRAVNTEIIEIDSPSGETIQLSRTILLAAGSILWRTNTGLVFRIQMEEASEGELASGEENADETAVETVEMMSQEVIEIDSDTGDEEESIENVQTEVNEEQSANTSADGQLACKSVRRSSRVANKKPANSIQAEETHSRASVSAEPESSIQNETADTNTDKPLACKSVRRSSRIASKKPANSTQTKAVSQVENANEMDDNQNDFAPGESLNEALEGGESQAHELASAKPEASVQNETVDAGKPLTSNSVRRSPRVANMQKIKYREQPESKPESEAEAESEAESEVESEEEEQSSEDDAVSRPKRRRKPSTSTNSARPFRCSVGNCSADFTTRARLRRHLLIHEEKKIPCPQCGKYFRHMHHLRVHQRIHTGVKPYKCSDCPAVFAFESTMRRHYYNTHRLTKPFPCPHCEKAFAYNHDLERHSRYHTGVKPFSCEQCGRDFAMKQHLLRHQTIHTGSKPYVCSICSEAFGHPMQLKRHSFKHQTTRPFPCDLCSKAFITAVELRHHQKYTKAHNKTPHYGCDTCGKRFTEKCSLKAHQRLHTGDGFPCSICSKMFTSDSIRRYHETTHSDEKPFTCPNCPYSSRKASALKVHLRTHTGERPYVCDVCSRAFGNVSTLRKHERIHSGEKPYPCKECPKRFPTSTALRQHEIIHTGLKPHVCSVCKKGFRQRNHLMRHMETAH